MTYSASAFLKRSMQYRPFLIYSIMAVLRDAGTFSFGMRQEFSL
jgi:hypothetical protein